MRKQLPIFFLSVCLYLPLPSISSEYILMANPSEGDLQHIQHAVSQLARNLSLEQFRGQIQEKYPTSYRFFYKLSAQQQKSVYHFYQTENNFEPIRHKIFTLFFAIPD